MCVNYGGRAELADAARSIAREVAAGRLDPEKVDEKTFARHLYVPELADADMVWRTSGEQRLSNFMLWQAAYAELVFTDVLWPDVDRRDLWQAIETLRRAATAGTARRDRLSRVRPSRAGDRPGSRPGRTPAARLTQAAQVPKISRVWQTSAKPCSAAIARVQRSTAGPSTSTVAPQARQTR